MGHPAFMSTNIDDFAFETLEYFETPTPLTRLASPIMCVDASDIMVCTWAGLSINVDIYPRPSRGSSGSLPTDIWTVTCAAQALAPRA